MNELPPAAWVYEAPGTPQRFEACFSGRAYAPHRHDHYTVAVTLGGVQSFDYRGQVRHSLPGNVLVLHPDELHDGRAGNDAPFRYRAINIDPRRIQGLLGGAPLPFLREAVSRDSHLLRAATAFLGELQRPLDALQYEDALFDLVSALRRLDGSIPRPGLADRRAAARALDYLDACPGATVSLARLEQISGTDRWQLSRDFRLLYGTSPYRYLLLRRLDRARRLLDTGTPLIEVAYACGFADQSHFTRHFRKAYGLTPRRWQRVLGGAQTF